MNNKSLFTKVILLIVVCVVCIVSTTGIALLAGAVDTTLFDFKNMNYANMIPVFIVGVFISCVIVGIAFLFVGKSAFFKVRDYLSENNNNNNNGGTKK